MAGQAEIKARLFNALEDKGFPCRLNYRFNLNRPVRGYLILVMDVAIVDGDHNPVYCFYIGKPKSRKVTKFELSGTPFSTCETADNIPKVVKEFTEWYWESGVNLKRMLKHPQSGGII